MDSVHFAAKCIVWVKTSMVASSKIGMRDLVWEGCGSSILYSRGFLSTSKIYTYYVFLFLYTSRNRDLP